MLPRKMKAPIVALTAVISLSSCGIRDKNPGRFETEIKKCDERYGIKKTEMDFLVSSEDYKKSSFYLEEIYELNGRKFSTKKICGYKILSYRSCYYFIDISERMSVGHKICVHPKNYSLTSYNMEI